MEQEEKELLDYLCGVFNVNEEAVKHPKNCVFENDTKRDYHNSNRDFYIDRDNDNELSRTINVTRRGFLDPEQ